jgi:hypothetical protein
MLPGAMYEGDPVPVADLEVALTIAAAVRAGGAADRRPTLMQLLRAFGEDELTPAARRRAAAALRLAGLHAAPAVLVARPDQRVVLSPAGGGVAGRVRQAVRAGWPASRLGRAGWPASRLGDMPLRPLLLGGGALVALLAVMALVAALGGSDTGRHGFSAPRKPEPGAPASAPATGDPRSSASAPSVPPPPAGLTVQLPPLPGRLLPVALPSAPPRGAVTCRPPRTPAGRSAIRRGPRRAEARGRGARTRSASRPGRAACA